MKAIRGIFLLIILVALMGSTSCVVVKRDRYGSHYRLNKKDSKYHRVFIHIGPNKGKEPRISPKGTYHPKH
ncbi:MAG TPA: hypothetical protein PLZ52_06790 [Bacteroidales bacterium]|nr:hypothetical protein [Bacteroidales bacterium]